MTATITGRAVLTAEEPVDLHLHTLASDGGWRPEELAAYLVEGGFRVAAVCDHDTQRSVAAFMRAGEELGLHVIPGVEMTTRWDDRQWHLLVYGIEPDRTDPAAAAFNRCLAEVDATLQERAADAARRFEESGRRLPSLDEFRAGRPLWPFHVLMTAINEKHVKDLKDAAELLIELGGNFTADLPMDAVVAAAHEAGGICVIAHPGRPDLGPVLDDDTLERLLSEIPVDGLEAHYRSYTDEQTRRYRFMAEDHGLLISCGSDSHAPGKPVDPRTWRAAWCRELLGRLGVDVVTMVVDEPVWTEGMDPLAARPSIVNIELNEGATVSSPLEILTFPAGPIETNAYLVIDTEAKQALVIDAPPQSADAIASAIEERGLSAPGIVITHAHWDHIGDAAELRRRTGAPLLAHRLAISKMESPGSIALQLPFEIEASRPDQLIDEGDTVALGDRRLKVLFLPGHEPGHIGLYSEPDKALFSGDVLFPNGHGRTDLPDSDQAHMDRSLAKLGQLPDDVTVYNGHGLPTTIGAERSWMPTAG